VALEARPAELEVAGERARLLTYNGRFPGPLIRAAEGDRLRVTLANALDEPTNLHFHGLHVSPEGSGDNVFIEVPPGGRHTYELVVPAGYGGTFWYHPHAHHRLARQLWRGLAGPIVIDRPLERAILELAAADEHVVVVKDLAIQDGEPAAHTTSDWARGKTGRHVLVNGMPCPRLKARASLVRLRLVNASNARMVQLARGDGRPLQLIGHEGHLLEAPQALERVLVTPAQRVDLLLPLEPGETLQLLHVPYNSGANRLPALPELLLELAPPAVATPAALPARLDSVERLDPAAATTRRRLRMAMAFMTPDGHPHLEPIRLRLGDLELWEIENVDTQDHVFHLHVWPFQVWRRNGVETPYPAWRDTINLRPGERVEILIPFRDFAGKAVYHCHVAEHGDAGMMSIVEVVA
jgi:FtsP/CotA-like multicopper oxidase with cupredoxin domain